MLALIRHMVDMYHRMGSKQKEIANNLYDDKKKWENEALIKKKKVFPAFLRPKLFPVQRNICWLLKVRLISSRYNGGNITWCSLGDAKWYTHFNDFIQ